MSEPKRLIRRVSGAGDLAWILAIFGVGAFVTALLVGHLRTEFAIYRLANARAALVSEIRDLEEQRRQLEIERQVRTERSEESADSDATQDLMPLRPEQVFMVEE